MQENRSIQCVQQPLFKIKVRTIIEHAPFIADVEQRNAADTDHDASQQVDPAHGLLDQFIVLFFQGHLQPCKGWQCPGDSNITGVGIELKRHALCERAGKPVRIIEIKWAIDLSKSQAPNCK